MRFCLAFGLAALLSVSSSSCLLPTDPIREPNVFSLSLTIPGAGEDYNVGNDTLTVVSFKMFIDSISVRKAGQAPERFEPKPRLASYVHGFAESYTIGTGALGGGTFEGIRYAIVVPSEAALPAADPDLVERDGTTGRVTNIYSVSIIGVYNRTVFRFRSKLVKAVQYDFTTNVRLPDYNGYLEARLRGNWRQWFLKTDGNGLLNPNDPRNKEQIETNLLKYFDVFTIAIGETS